MRLTVVSLMTGIESITNTSDIIIGIVTGITGDDTKQNINYIQFYITYYQV